MRRFLHIAPLIMGFFVVSTTAEGQLPELNLQVDQTRDEIQTVTELIREGSGTPEVGFILSLARNYYKLDQYDEAQEYYLQIIDQPLCSPLDFKALAISLFQTGSYSLAEEFKNIYLGKVNGDSGFELLWGDMTLGRLRSDVETKRLSQTNYNSVYGYLGADGLARLSIDHGAVSGEILCNQLTAFSAIDIPVTDFNRLGSYTIGPKENSLIYSYEGDDGYYSLFYIEQKKGKWKKARKIDLGESLAHYIHPMFDPDLGVLYYSSDRTGGEGGFDLYSAIHVNGNWAANSNLGRLVNSDKNELLPSLLENRFCFTSNGHPGQGGYDVYSATRNFSEVRLIEAPFNSSGNELMVLSMSHSNALMICSDGKSSNLVDIVIDKTPLETAKGIITDGNNNPVSNVLVLLSSNNIESGFFTQTDANGHFRIEVPDTVSNWFVRIMRNGYQPRSMEYSMAELENGLKISLNQEKEQKSDMEQVYIVNSPSRNVIPTTPRNDQPTTSSSDNQPTVFNELESQDSRYYVIFGSTHSYSSAYSFWESWKGKFPNAEILQYAEKGIYRVGEYAGTSKEEAMQVYRNAIKIKSDVWLLRPDSQ
ncbi:MAG: hypothetical protein KDC76_02600 [Bacteroidetes bacterium]|nr:hypothetical protein [Bacteroidota bacterium]